MTGANLFTAFIILVALVLSVKAMMSVIETNFPPPKHPSLFAYEAGLLSQTREALLKANVFFENSALDGKTTMEEAVAAMEEVTRINLRTLSCFNITAFDKFEDTEKADKKKLLRMVRLFYSFLQSSDLKHKNRQCGELTLLFTEI